MDGLLLSLESGCAHSGGEVVVYRRRSATLRVVGYSELWLLPYTGISTIPVLVRLRIGRCTQYLGGRTVVCGRHSTCGGTRLCETRAESESEPRREPQKFASSTDCSKPDHKTEFMA